MRLKEILKNKKKSYDHLERMRGWELWDYRLRGEVYSGAVSTVCRALAPDDEMVVLKFMNVDLANIREARRLFQQEAHLTAQWNHPKLIQVIDYYPEVHQPTLVLGFFHDRNLKQRLMHKEKILKTNGLSIMRQALEGLQYIHDEGYIHRDIKPENILVNDEGESRLIDFTLTVKKDALNFGIRKISGTRSYIAPETIRRRAPVPATDIYSLGISFYEMVAYRLPFVAADGNTILRKHLKEPPTSLKSFDPNINPVVDEIILKMLAKKPENRPESCGFILAKLADLDSIYMDNGDEAVNRA